MNALPRTLVVVVFNRLNGYHGLLRCVCRTWRDILSESTQVVEYNMCATLPLFQWASKHGMIVYCSGKFHQYAARQGCLEVFQNMAKRYSRLGFGPRMNNSPYYAALHGHEDIVVWILQHDPSYYGMMLDGATRGKQHRILDVLTLHRLTLST